ncbi:MAG: hypothetical protein OXI73_11950 [Rhodospirillales bacterium]|nr:hypothetical protein [Rhodospirillales bacterium]
MKPPAIGTTVAVPALHPSSVYGAAIREEWSGQQKGRMVELVDWNHPHDPLVCLEIDGEGGKLFAWFLTSHIGARTLADPEFSLSADAMVSEHRPRRTDDNLVEIFFPEDGWWYAVKRYRGTGAQS